jgi:hypothetical protein
LGLTETLGDVHVIVPGPAAWIGLRDARIGSSVTTM